MTPGEWMTGFESIWWLDSKAQDLWFVLWIRGAENQKIWPKRNGKDGGFRFGECKALVEFRHSLNYRETLKENIVIITLRLQTPSDKQSTLGTWLTTRRAPSSSSSLPRTDQSKQNVAFGYRASEKTEIGKMCGAVTANPKVRWLRTWARGTWGNPALSCIIQR